MADAEPDHETEPVTESEVTESEEAEPEATESEEAEPEEAEPEATESEEPRPEATKPETTDPVAKVDPLTRADLDTSSVTTRSRIILALIAALVVGIILGRLSASEDDADAGSDEAATTTTVGGVGFPSGDQERANYWGLAGLRPVVNDAFDRGDNPDGLGRATTAQQWNEVRGQWAISQNQAQLLDAGRGDGPAIAVTAGAQGDGLVEVTLPVVEAGAGLVFRYLDPENYWSVLADPETGTWTVFKTLEGETELVSDVSASTANGVTITTIHDPTRIRILVEGEDVLLINDEDLGRQLQGGLIASGDSDGSARWDRFLVMNFPAAANAPAGG